MLQSKTNLQQLSPTGFITEFSYNFTILPVIINHQSVWVRRSNRLKYNNPRYVFKRKYKKKPKSFYYCEKCNAFQRFKTCLSCENKLYSPSDFDTSSTISSDSEIDMELNIDRLNLREVSTKLSFQLDSSQTENNDETVDNFRYISTQNGYLGENEIYFSDNELRMDSDVSDANS